MRNKRYSIVGEELDSSKAYLGLVLLALAGLLSHSGWLEFRRKFSYRMEISHQFIFNIKTTFKMS
jgi:hypothetical protein